MLSGLGTAVVAESHSLSAGSAWLTNKNVLVTNVYVGSHSTTAEYARWYCTPRGYLTIIDRATTTDSFNATYRWWAEDGEKGQITGVVKEWGGFFNWSVDHTCDVVERTDFDSGGVKVYLATLDGWTGTAEKHWISTQEELFLKMGSSVPMIVKFYVDDDDTDKGIGSGSDTGSRYEGYAHLTGLSPSTAVDALVNESLSFQGTGILTYESG